MATKAIQVLCLIALFSASLAIPVDEPKQVVVQDVVQPVVHEDPKPIEPQGDQPGQESVVSRVADVAGGSEPDDLAASPDANPGVPQGEGADLETANTFGFGYYGGGYRPWGYGGGWRRGYSGRGYGGGWGGGWGGYGGYGGYRGGWGGGWRGGYGGYWG